MNSLNYHYHVLHVKHALWSCNLGETPIIKGQFQAIPQHSREIKKKKEKGSVAVVVNCSISCFFLTEHSKNMPLINTSVSL